ncbi:MAG: septum formation initiator family protein [Pseudomonadota bacterium]|nr:septum formation initiator family protein [Pseudomonadota bacterium]
MFNTLSGRIVFGLGLVVIAALQFQLWFGESGYQDRQELMLRVDAQQQENQQLAERNRVLRAEVNDLKNGLEAVEEHARLDLGLIKPNETFVQMSTLPPPTSLNEPSMASEQP